MAIEWQVFETSPPPNSGFFSYDSCVDRLKPFSASLRKDLMPPTHLTSPEKNLMNFRRRFGLVQKLNNFNSPETYSQNCFKRESAGFYGKGLQELPPTCKANVLTTICFNGGLIAKRKGSISLAVYSTPFARFILKNGIRTIDLKFENGGFRIAKGVGRGVTIQRQNRNQPLCIFSVTKLIPRCLKKKLFSSGKQKRVNVIVEGFISKEGLRKYNNATTAILPEEKLDPIPEDEKIDVGCFIACSRTKNSMSFTFKIRHRILEEIATKKEKVALKRDKDGNFVIRKSTKGREFNLYKHPQRYSLEYIQIAHKFITEKERKLFESGRRCISYRAFLSEKEFNLNVSKFFYVREERELASALLEKGIAIKIPKMRSRQADILLKKDKAQIEITNILPSNGTNKNNPHGEGMHINGRLCEGFLKVKKKETPLFFVVFNKKWLKQGWLRALVKQVKPEVNAITTDFEGAWANKIAEQIIYLTKK